MSSALRRGVVSGLATTAAMAGMLTGGCAVNPVSGRPEVSLALPGGYVYVSRGLLALMNSEDELAGVLGHEIGHVAARHAVRRVTRAAPLAVLTGLGAAVTGIVSPTVGDLVGGIGDAAGALVLAPYSRGHVRKLDDLPIGPRAADGVFDGET